MSHTPMCFWCGLAEIGSEIASDAFCSNACLDEWTAIQNLDLRAEDDDFEDEDFEDEDGEDHMTDVEADADTLASAGYGTDEDYGYFGGDDDHYSEPVYTDD